MFSPLFFHRVPKNGTIEGLIPKRYRQKLETKPKGSQKPGRPPQKAMPMRNIAPVQKTQKTRSQITPAALLRPRRTVLSRSYSSPAISPPRAEAVIEIVCALIDTPIRYPKILFHSAGTAALSS